MLDLSRTVRFCVNPAVPQEREFEVEATNTFAGWPPMMGLGAYYEITVCCRGVPDPQTGFVTGIGPIDHVVRTRALPILSSAFRAARTDVGRVLAELAAIIGEHLEVPVVSVSWQLTPYHGLSIDTDDMSRILLRQQFEFAAAHRLHRPELSDDENRAIFGKCNNPNGHGHNYRLEVAVSRSTDDETLSLPKVEHIVHETVITRFDHRHLNLDTPAFADLNPTVEHIAKVCADLLADPLAEAGGRLEAVTVWETEKTCCTYRV